MNDPDDLEALGVSWKIFRYGTNTVEDVIKRSERSLCTMNRLLSFAVIQNFLLGINFVGSVHSFKSWPDGFFLKKNISS